MKPNSNCFSLRPATREEASLFYSDDQTDRSLGTVGHVRMDFGSSGKGFYHTWWPHNGDRFNTPEFKEALQQFVDAVREDGPLKDLPSMGQFCRQNGGAITEDGRSYGYLAEMGDYRFCLRCTPSPGEYQCYLYCYDLRQQTLDRPVGRVSFANGEHMEFTAPQDYLRTIREELGLQVVLGVSNISFGLPNRKLITQNFLIQAMHAGLTLPIINPNQTEMMDAVAAYRVLSGEDRECRAYVARFAAESPAVQAAPKADALTLGDAVIRGLKADAGKLAAKALETEDELSLVENHLIPALDKVGEDYEIGRAHV